MYREVPANRARYDFSIKVLMFISKRWNLLNYCVYKAVLQFWNNSQKHSKKRVLGRKLACPRAHALLGGPDRLVQIPGVPTLFDFHIHGHTFSTPNPAIYEAVSHQLPPLRSSQDRQPVQITGSTHTKLRECRPNGTRHKKTHSTGYFFINSITPTRSTL